MCALHVELFCDPYAVGSWRHRPTLKHVAYAFPELEWTLRPIVAHPEPLSGEAAETFAADARSAASAAGLPAANDDFGERVPASWVACEALIAARADDADAALELYNRLSARLFAGGDPATTAKEVASVATDIDGLDADAVRAAVGSRRVTAALGRDLEIGRALLANRNQYEFRGTPEELPLADRLYGDVSAPLDNPTGAEPAADGTENADVADDAEDVDDADDAEDTDDVETEGGSKPPTVPAPPLVRVRAGSHTVVVDPAGGHQEFADVLGRFDADLGRPAWEEKLYGRKAMQSYGMEQRTAENISGEDYPEKAEKVLSIAGESFVADVAACTLLDPDTCRVALRKLGAQGRAERGPSGGWRPVANRED